jgi:hypothetical protein
MRSLMICIPYQILLKTTLTEHVACIGEKRNIYMFLVEGLGVDGKIILKWILKLQLWMAWTEFIWHRIWTSGDL